MLKAGCATLSRPTGYGLWRHPYCQAEPGAYVRPQAGAWEREEEFSKLLKSVGRVSRAILGA